MLLSDETFGPAVASLLLHHGALPQLLTLAVAPLVFTPSRTMTAAGMEQTALLATAAVSAVASREQIEMDMPWLGALSVEGQCYEEKLLQLCALGHEVDVSRRALELNDDNLGRAQQCLESFEEETAAEPPSATPAAEELALELSRMGFAISLCRDALLRSSYDIQAAADLLLNLDPPTVMDVPHSPNGDATVAGAGAVGLGSRIEVSDECGQWHEAVVVAARGTLLKVRYEGWPEAWSDWHDSCSSHLRAPRTGLASRGPNASPLDPGTPPASCASQEEEAEAAASSKPRLPTQQQPPTQPRHRSRGQSWFRRGQPASTSRRQAFKDDGSLARTCPSPDADFFPTDAGLARVIEAPPHVSIAPPSDRAAHSPSSSPANVTQSYVHNPAGQSNVSCAAFLNVAPQSDQAGHSPRSSPTNAPQSYSHSPTGRTVFSCPLPNATQSSTHSPTGRPKFSCAALRVLEQSVPGLQGYCSLGLLLRCACLLHGNVASLHARKCTLALLCNLAWLRSAHEDFGSNFTLASIGDLASVLSLFKLACASPPQMLPAPGRAWDALVGLLRDRSLRSLIPNFGAMPAVLAAEGVNFLARSATSSRYLESTHPSSVTHALQMIHCPGASMIQICFDSRSRLSRGSRLALYLDAACTQQIVNCEGGDLSTLESLWVPSGRVWIHYQCTQV